MKKILKKKGKTFGRFFFGFITKKRNNKKRKIKGFGLGFQGTLFLSPRSLFLSALSPLLSLPPSVPPSPFSRKFWHQEEVMAVQPCPVDVWSPQL